MPHEVVQGIKLVKSNRKSHEMISVTCKRIPTTVNKEIHKNTQMKWRGFGAESPSGLHCTNQYWSMDHLMDRSSNHHCIGSTTITIPDRVRVSCNGSGSYRTNPKRCGTWPTHTYKHKYTINTHTCTRTHTCTPTYTYIYKHTHTYIHTICIHTHTYIHIIFIYTYK